MRSLVDLKTSLYGSEDLRDTSVLTVYPLPFLAIEPSDGVPIRDGFIEASLDHFPGLKKIRTLLLITYQANLFMDRYVYGKESTCFTFSFSNGGGKL